jgi:hypothetical protein
MVFCTSYHNRLSSLEFDLLSILCGKRSPNNLDTFLSLPQEFVLFYLKHMEIIIVRIMYSVFIEFDCIIRSV